MYRCQTKKEEQEIAKITPIKSVKRDPSIDQNELRTQGRKKLHKTLKNLKSEVANRQDASVNACVTIAFTPGLNSNRTNKNRKRMSQQKLNKTNNKVIRTLNLVQNKVYGKVNTGKTNLNTGSWDGKRKNVWMLAGNENPKFIKIILNSEINKINDEHVNGPASYIHAATIEYSWANNITLQAALEAYMWANGLQKLIHPNVEIIYNSKPHIMKKDENTNTLMTGEISTTTNRHMSFKSTPRQTPPTSPVAQKAQHKRCESTYIEPMQSERHAQVNAIIEEEESNSIEITHSSQPPAKKLEVVGS